MEEHFIVYHKKDIAPHIELRKGEYKLGEGIGSLDPGEGLKDLEQYTRKGFKYAILGIPDSIGPLANFGNCCAENAWQAFLSCFLNVQSNRFLTGEDILLLGQVDCQPLKEKAAGMLSAEDLRELCARLDDYVHPVVESVFRSGLIPVVIGGGHNNAYPILKGITRALSASRGIDCINCDPHADFRALEGRHSGNGFSYAFRDGFLDRYYVFGLHEGYNSQGVMEGLDASPRIGYSRFEEPLDFRKRIALAVDFLGQPEHPIGLELDLDSISGMPTSAVSPSGWSVEQARCYVREMASAMEVAYLHLPEGAPEPITPQMAQVGKTLAYLVSDFIKAVKGRRTEDRRQRSEVGGWRSEGAK